MAIRSAVPPSSSSFTTQVRDVIVSHGMITAGDRLLLGVSGGADSVALLVVLLELGYAVAAAHVNHGLRGQDSDADQEFVRNLARQCGVVLFEREVQLPANANIEVAGREARRAFFSALCEEHGFTRIGLAHNREDRIETFLLNLMRGAGLDGLVSMSPVRGKIIRPLIESSRSDIEAYLKNRGLSWRTDTTNFDISFSRNRLRHEVLPNLTSLFNVRLPETLARTAALLEEENEYLQQVAGTWLDRFSIPGPPGGGIRLEAAQLQELPKAMIRRIVRQALKRAGFSLQDVTFDHIEAIRSLLAPGKSGKTVQLPAGARVFREFGHLVMGDEPAECVEFSYELPIPGMVYVSELGQTFRADVLSTAEGAESPNRVLADGSRLGERVRVRNWAPGDYYRPQGWPGGKVKKLFQRARIPKSRRNRWPVVEADNGLVWVPRFPVSKEFAVVGNAQKIVAFEALQG